ncbi:MAG: hypothetical protein IPL08_10480 [Saprospiraceae bacterium]|nr:hypothetical protein [Saprospiraceae bacterium]
MNSITGTLLASNVASYTPTTTLATSPQTICVEAVETGDVLHYARVLQLHYSHCLTSSRQLQ